MRYRRGPMNTRMDDSLSNSTGQSVMMVFQLKVLRDHYHVRVSPSCIPSFRIATPGTDGWMWKSADPCGVNTVRATISPAVSVGSAAGTTAQPNNEPPCLLSRADAAHQIQFRTTRVNKPYLPVSLCSSATCLVTHKEAWSDVKNAQFATLVEAQGAITDVIPRPKNDTLPKAMLLPFYTGSHSSPSCSVRFSFSTRTWYTSRLVLSLSLYMSRRC